MILEEYRKVLTEITQQPRWRANADKEMDYADGRQLDSELLKRQKELGIPPAIDNVISPTITSLEGYERNTRADWRVTAKGIDNPDDNDVADFLNFKLNEAEEDSKADQACSAAFRGQIVCGIGWVEVSRDGNPFNFPYRCLPIHRNEIFWDMKAKSPILEDANWLLRKRWVLPENAALMFPDHAEMFENIKSGAYFENALNLDGGGSTGLNTSWGDGAAPTTLEEYWFNPSSREVLIVELWQKKQERVSVIKTPNGRIVEYNPDDMRHAVAVASGSATVVSTVVSKMRRSYWCNSTMLYESATPYKHQHYPYVPFFGFREDNSNLPYGYVRDMIYSQDNINSAKSKLRWGLSVTRVERTKGAVLMSDKQLRDQVARPDADIVLDPKEMAKQGAKFEVKRDYQLTQQHYQMIYDDRETIKRTSNITDSFMGAGSNARSGIQEDLRREQSNQSVSKIMTNFQEARMQVGELLLNYIIEDIGSEPQTIILKGDMIKKEREISVNQPNSEGYLDNDVQKTRIKVSLEDVPTTASYRMQQYTALSEAIKSLPPNYHIAAMPFLINLMDVPFKNEIMQTFREVTEQKVLTEEDVAQRIEQAIRDKGLELKEREVAVKENKSGSEIKEIEAKSVQIGVQAAFAAMQAGVQVAQMPQIAAVADDIMQGAGYKEPTPAGDDPNLPTASVPVGEQPEVIQNTSPQLPPVPQQAGTGMTGIETP